jgi:hypothetical protein
MLLISCLLDAPAPNLAYAVPQQDNSDWWSLLRGNDNEADIKPEKREFKESNFHILGIGLAETMFSQANERLGAAATIQRGDASSAGFDPGSFAWRNKSRCCLKRDNNPRIW